MIYIFYLICASGSHVTRNSAVPDPNVWCCILLFLCTLGAIKHIHTWHTRTPGGSEKEGGGNDASLHSAMFDSARARGVLRCYDGIDRVVRGLSLSLWCLLCEWRQNGLQKDSLSVPLFCFLATFEFTNRLHEKKKTCRTKSNGSVRGWNFTASFGHASCKRTPSTSGFFPRTLPQTTSQRPPEVRSFLLHVHRVRKSHIYIQTDFCV